MGLSTRDEITITLSVIALLISIISLGRTFTSLSVFREKKDDSVTVTNDSPHAVTIIEIGVVNPDGTFKEISSDDYSVQLPHRIDSRDVIVFHPKTYTTIARTLVQMNYGREGTYIKIAGGNFFGSSGRVCSDVGYFKRKWWWIRSKFIDQKEKQ